MFSFLIRYAPTLCLVVCLSVAGSLGAEPPHQHEHSEGPPERLGKVDFPVSCNKQAQTAFTRGVALMHSFQYGDAEKGFGDVAEVDPKCAMAYWGVAMSLYHPVWAAANPSAEPKPEELARGRAAVEKARTIGAPTERERDYIEAIGVFYADSERADHATRALAYEKGMERVAARHPEDQEATIFYALSLLGTASPGDKTYAKQKHAAELLNRVLPQAPEHPGVAHYLIHSFDYPTLASLALPAARAYSKIAPSSPHALHMPSHIFTRLGLWDESIRSNLDSAAAARALMKKKGLQATHYDELHAMDYLAYAYLQTCRDRKAQEVVADVKAVKAVDAQSFSAAYAFAAGPARSALELHHWAEAARLTVLPEWFAWDRFTYAEAITHFARGLGAARSGDAPGAKAALARLDAIRDGLVAKHDTYWADQLEIERRAVQAWLARAAGKNDEALALMRDAADREDATEKSPVTPGPVLPARELLGDLLLELGRPEQALPQFEASLVTSPGRFNSLYGAALSAERAGQRDKALDLYRQVDALCKDSDATRPELTAARESLAAKR